MIRREPSEGESPGWIVIPQMDHAHLAGQLAETWGASGFPPLEPREELLWAVYHHDDGWRAWDAAPGVDPATGRPRNFLEMDLDDSLAIWEGSIRAAEAAGPLEALVVAGHFLALLERGLNRPGRPAPSPAAGQFLRHYQTRREAWLDAWTRRDPRRNTAEVARQALAQLQFFDVLSLWFCCREAREPESLPALGGQALRLTPDGPIQWSVAPWPWTGGPLNIEVAAWKVPEGRYAGRLDLAAIPAQPIRLRWRLRSTAAGG